MKKKLRPLGDITADLEPLLLEMTESHKMQVHEVLGVIHAYLMVHCPDAFEEYEDGSGSPVLWYGTKEKLR
jgi:hypothetical protein